MPTNFHLFQGYVTNLNVSSHRFLSIFFFTVVADSQKFPDASPPRFPITAMIQRGARFPLIWRDAPSRRAVRKVRYGLVGLFDLPDGAAICHPLPGSVRERGGGEQSTPLHAVTIGGGGGDCTGYPGLKFSLRSRLPHRLTIFMSCTRPPAYERIPTMLIALMVDDGNAVNS